MAWWWWYLNTCEQGLGAALLSAHREGEVELGTSGPGEGVLGQARGSLGIAGLPWPGRWALPAM
jgi:hypothetical protein